MAEELNNKDFLDDEFKKIFFDESKRHSVIYGCIKSLSYYVQSSSAKTCQGLMKEIEPACLKLQELASGTSDIMNGKTIMTVKAVCAIYQNMVNKVASGTEESLGLSLIKEKIQE